MLGSSASVEDPTSTAVSHRLRSAWKACVGIRPQLQIYAQPVCLRLALLEAVVLPSLLWGLECLWLTLPDIGCLRAVRRTLVARCIRILAKPAQPREEFLRRRERVVTRWIKQACRGRWDEIQRYRCLKFFGHAVRSSDEHVVERALRWCGVRCWQRYTTHHRTKWGGQQGRRPADQGNSVHMESRIQWYFMRYATLPEFSAVRERLKVARPLSCWMDLAYHREEYRAFTKWAGFGGDDRADVRGREIDACQQG